MKKLLPWVKKNYVFASPFLIALYTVLFLYSKNEPEYRVQVVITPIVIALVFTAILFTIFRFLLKSAAKAAILTSILTFIALSYGRFFEAENNFSFKFLGLAVSSEIVAMVVLAVVFIGIAYATAKTHKNLIAINKLFVIGSLVLLVFPIFNIISYEAKTGRIWRPKAKQSSLQVQKVDYKGPRPDIYYIILDRYDGQRSLKEQLGFDNSKFLTFLKDKGFYVPQNSTANYPKTFLSFGASLNMEYMDDLTRQTNGGESSDESLVTPLIQNNKLIAFLKSRGYTYVQVGSWWQPTTINPNADISYYPPKKGYPFADEFTTGFLNTTIAAPVFQVIFHDPVNVSVDPQNNLHRRAALYEYEAMKDAAKLPGPKFVFAHILLPHDPFVFDKDCNPISEKVVNTMQHQQNYINQLKCANTKTEQMIKDIFALSKTKPVIVLQADEGTFPMNSPLPPNQGWGSASDQALREKFPILNSYYFPDGDTNQLYDDITPVNSFRVILNKYFGENLPLLPDKNYVFQDEDHYYKFLEVTDKVKD